MSPLAVRGKHVARVAQDLGFKYDRTTGSHDVYYREADKRRVVIPMHAGKTLKPKTLAGIVRDMGLTLEEFAKLV